MTKRKLFEIIFTAVLAVPLCLSAVVVKDAQKAKGKKVPDVLAGHNGNFEQGMEHWKKLWGKASIDSSTKHSGKNSLRIDGSSELKSGLRIKVEPGYQYHISAWGRLKNFHFRKDHLYGCGFGLEQLRKDGHINGNWYKMYCYLKYAEGNTGWFYEEAYWIPRETTAFLRPSIRVKSSTGSQVWYDDIRIWKQKIPQKDVSKLVNVIENSSFEIKYKQEKTPFAFILADINGKRVDFGELAVATTEQVADRTSSLKIMKPCSVTSSPGMLEGKKMFGSIAYMTENINGAGGYARLELVDAAGKVVKVVKEYKITGNNSWKALKVEADIPESKQQLYGRWVIGMDKDTTGTIYVDDLKLLVSSKLAPMPFRNKNIKKAKVTVNAGVMNGKTFESPLCAYDRHCSDRVYSYSIGTAGPHLEGENRWFESRTRLGIKYVRVHNGLDGNGLCEHYAADGKRKFSWSNGERGVKFGAARINPETGKPFPPVCRIDKSGEMITDFSSIRYYLDKAVLKGGTKPILGIEPVPTCLAIERNKHYKPKSEKQWEEFVYRFITYLVETYGEDEVKTWIFETGNEPGTEPTFHGRPGRPDILNDFIEMQDYTIAGARRALPDIFIAGPSGPPEQFMMPMLKHCAEGKNLATGKLGTRIDAISYHGYLGGSAGDLSWRGSEQQILRFLRYREYYEKKTGRKLGFYNTEFAPIYMQVPPKNPPESCYDNHVQAVATLHMANFSYRLGVDKMAFFYGSPTYFAPVRGETGFKKSPMQHNTPEFLGEPTMITFHGIFKPVCRIFQMTSWLNNGQEIETKASCRPIYSIAVKDGKAVKVICYSYDVNPKAKYVTSTSFKVEGLDKGKTYQVTRYEVSATKSNSWYLASKEKITQAMCEKDISLVDKINSASELKPKYLGKIRADENGAISFKLKVPSFSASLLEIKLAE